MSLPILNYGTREDQGDAVLVAREDAQSATAPRIVSQGPSRPLGDAAKGKPPRPKARKKQVPGQSQRDYTKGRSTSVYRVVERLLESELKTESELLEAVQLFTGMELLQVAEERGLQNTCGNPICDSAVRSLSAIDRLTLNDDATAAHAFCSSECELKIRRMAGRLGNEEAAISRYTRAASGVSSNTALASHPSRPQPSQPLQEQKYAAGGTNTPIMLAQVQEREFSEPPVPPSGNGSSAVEGFAPRHQPASITNKPAESNGDAEMREVAAERDEFSPEGNQPELAGAARPKGREPTSDDEDNASVAERFELEHLDFAPPESSSEDEFEPDREQGQAVLGASFPWLEEAPAEGRGMRLSVFGLVHDALDCLLTDASLEFCQGGQPLAPKIADERQRQVLHALQQALGSSLGGELSRALRLSVPRTAIDQHLVELLHTFDLHAPVPSMKAAGWRLLALVLLKALSMERLPQLRSSFEGPEALGRVAALLATDQLDLDHFSCLLELVLATD